MSDAVLERTADWVRARWLVTGEFDQAREMALAGPRPHLPAEVEEYARTGVGLAAAYVGLGMHGAALVTSALALSWGGSGYEGSVQSAIGVVFSEALLNAEGRRLLIQEFGWHSA